MSEHRDPFTRLDPDEVRDLGFGETVARDSRRLLNRDGTYNSGRHGFPRLRSVPLYESLATISWRKFYLLALVGYFSLDLFFAFVYLALGPEALHGTTASSALGRFAEAFFFSVHTSTTVGYGTLAPATTAANLVVAVEAFVGLAGFAVMAALLFSRLSRPTADLRFSEQAVVAPYRGITGFMFRIANGSRRDLVDASVRVLFSWLDGDGANRKRQFETLELERGHITFFPMHWTVVHPIDESSPLYGWDAARLLDAHAEFLVQVAATAEIYSQVVRGRGSYVADEVVFGARFVKILEETESGGSTIDIRRISEIERPS
ncbi:MAG: ion channel [Acidimicrobiia bacterium]